MTKGDDLLKLSPSPVAPSAIPLGLERDPIALHLSKMGRPVTRAAWLTLDRGSSDESGLDPEVTAMLDRMFPEVEEPEYRSGGTGTTQIGYQNRNDQRCDGHRGMPGNDHGQKAYRLTCLKCGNEYGANGTDIFQRRCPNCQGGEAGIEF